MGKWEEMITVTLSGFHGHIVMDCMFLSDQNSYLETLISSVIEFGDVAFAR